ncbi:pirin family protein [Pseudomonas sp. C27(2019)]|uniref:pirin family protein n=1 Tax=Pseudomonas sp. C27(2019) TaxID=2604941 RepID=UPI0012460684|nr:pirin family protein [Pseudomonas sp. C27(2019)]QEY59061.1 pirin family protein [Pseudomonas sp. C27(2019)]
MSNQNKTVDSPCAIESGCTLVQQLIHPKDQELGGFTVRRSLPTRGARRIGPWVFFDHMGPADFPAGAGVNIAPHPHINMATVTYLLDGEMLHQDSVGSVQSIRPGDLNLMVAGSGIVHSERQSGEVKSQPHSIHGFQLWLALPEQDEETDPAFYHYAAEQIPSLNIGGVALRVLMGTAYGATSPVKTFSPTLYIEAQLQAGQSLTLPHAAMRGLYVASGEVCINDLKIAHHRLALLSDDHDIIISAERDSQVVLIGGDDIGHRYMDWNFVSSRIERVKQARQQWIDQQFAKIPTDNQEFIPYPNTLR